MLLQAFRDQLRDRLGVDEDDLDDTKVDAMLNFAYWDVLARRKFREKEKTVTFPTEDGEREYELPVAFEAIRKISIEDDEDSSHTVLDRMEIDTYENTFVNTTDAEGKPTNYVREGCSIKLYPTPDKVYTITLKYRKNLADITDDNNDPDCPREWDQVILAGAVSDGFRYLGDYPRATQELAFYEHKIKTLEESESKDQEDSPRAGLQPIVPEYP